MAKDLERIFKWDNLKFLLIFCVVIGHIAEKYTGDYIYFKRLFLLIYIFHMPAFLFLSGLFQKKTIKEKRYNKIFSFLLLYFVIKIIMAVSSYVIYGTGRFSLFSEPELAWYAGAVFACCLITVFIRNVDWRQVLIGSIILACFAGYDDNVGDYLIASRIIVYYPFFFAGYLIDPSKLTELTRKWYIKICSLTCLTAGVMYVITRGEEIYWLRPLVTGRNPFSKLEFYSELGGLIRLLYYVVVFAIILALIAVIPNIKIPVLSGIGKRSIAVYAFHFCAIDVIWGIFGFGDYMCSNVKGLPFYLSMFAMAFVITWFTSLPIWEKLLRWLTTPKMKREI